MSNRAAWVNENIVCKKCRWPIVTALTNEEMDNYKGEKHADYWTYCANKTCSNHEGEGHCTNLPKWTESK